MVTPLSSEEHVVASGDPSDDEPDGGSPGYPAEWHADTVLIDGRPAHLRPLLPTDAPLYLGLLDGLSAESRYYRFFTPKPTLSEAEIEHFINVDHVDRVALVAIVDREIVGVARYDRETPATAELAIAVADDFQGLGVGTALLHHLTQAARDRGIEVLLANLLADNTKMLHLLQRSGYPLTRHFDGGVLCVQFPTSDPGPLA